jgi:hypothetical protein
MDAEKTKLTITPEKFSALLQKIEAVKKEKPLDLSAAEDLSVGIMNLIALEEHFFFTGAKTGDGAYHDLSQEIREMRKEFMKELVPKEKYEGETWCATKHLLSATMRFIEVGGKYRTEGKREASDRTLAAAYRLYSIFVALRLRLIDARRLTAEARRAQQGEKQTLDELVARLANCCDE